MIQLPQVIASIANDLSKAIDVESGGAGTLEAGPSVSELQSRMEDSGGTVPAPASGYLQFIRNETLVRLATAAPRLRWLNDLIAVSTGDRERNTVRIHVHEVL